VLILQTFSSQVDNWNTAFSQYVYGFVYSLHAQLYSNWTNLTLSAYRLIFLQDNILALPLLVQRFSASPPCIHFLFSPALGIFLDRLDGIFL
jgi:hypothetical protein